MLESTFSRVETLTSSNSSSSSQLHYGKFYFADLKKGQGITFANSLRRVLLYDIPGQGVTHIRLQVPLQNTGSEQIHEFSAIPGMRESILELIFHLRGVVCKTIPRKNEDSNPHIFHFSLKETLTNLHENDFETPTSTQLRNQSSGQRPFVFRAKHLKNPFIVNPEHYLATILPEQCPDFEFDYVIGENSENSNADFSQAQFHAKLQNTNLPDQNPVWLPTDGSFFPVKKVNYSITEGNLSVFPGTRNAELRNFAKSEGVFLEIWTNGAQSPEAACSQALDILIHLFQEARGDISLPPAS